MMQQGILMRSGVVAMVVALGLTLSACLLVPGKFASALDLRKGGQFAFTYRGEISMFGLAQLAAMDKSKNEFKEQTCYDEGQTEAPAPKAKGKKAADDDAMVPAIPEMKERPCTADEIAQQKKDWEESRKDQAERDKKEMGEMKAALGGLDPTDPKSIEEFAARLRRQAGWQVVTYKGNGLFDVDFAITGRLDHDFIFPVIEKFPTTNTFVQLIRRTDGTVRVDTPGFFAGANGNPMAQAFGMGMMGKMSDKDMPKAPEIDGTFTITTNGQVLANNTDAGPKAVPGGKQLDWAVNVRSAAAPTALIKLN